MTKMKYLIPDVDKHTAGVIYISMIAFLLLVAVATSFIPQ